ncbi:MAG: hypothetical protein OXT65_02835 [Alphaproteobacteria bacterium]|nr:hypothetical protein [Alphaproteobacteria bacterium]
MADKNQKTDIMVFLDIDGVFSDMDKHLKDTGMVDDAGKINYDALDHNWWASMPEFDGARNFLDDIKSIAPFKFLTGPMLNDGCFSGKAAWMKKFRPDRDKFAVMDLIICPSKDKHLLAGPTRILIDDRESNCNDWREAGGIAIHHKGDYAQTMAELKKELALLGYRNTVRDIGVPKP